MHNKWIFACDGIDFQPFYTISPMLRFFAAPSGAELRSRNTSISISIGEIINFDFDFDCTSDQRNYTHRHNMRTCAMITTDTVCSVYRIEITQAELGEEVEKKNKNNYKAIYCRRTRHMSHRLQNSILSPFFHLFFLLIQSQLVK